MSFDNSKVIATKGYLIGAADAIRRKLESQDTIPLPEFEDAIDSIPTGGGGTTATSIEIVKELPITLVEGAVYLIPNGEQVCPSIPTGYDYNVICIDKNDIGDAYKRPSTQDVLNATKFWLFQNNTIQPRNRRDQITIITWGSSATTSTKPTKIYEYDTSGAFEWIDITNDASTDTDFQNNTILHDNRDTIYSDTNIYRYTVGNLEYNTETNKINNLCKLTDIFYIDDFDVYFVENGVATSQGSHTLKWVAENYN